MSRRGREHSVWTGHVQPGFMSGSSASPQRKQAASALAHMPAASTSEKDGIHGKKEAGDAIAGFIRSIEVA
jgi:hypothetical protein